MNFLKPLLAHGDFPIPPIFVYLFMLLVAAWVVCGLLALVNLGFALRLKIPYESKLKHILAWVFYMPLFVVPMFPLATKEGNPVLGILGAIAALALPAAAISHFTVLYELHKKIRALDARSKNAPRA